MIRNCCESLDLVALLILHFFVSSDNFSLFSKVFSHLGDLTHVLTLETDNLLEGFLIHSYHFHILSEMHVLIVRILIGERLACLHALLYRQIRLPWWELKLHVFSKRYRLYRMNRLGNIHLGHLLES